MNEIEIYGRGNSLELALDGEMDPLIYGVYDECVCVCARACLNLLGLSGSVYVHELYKHLVQYHSV